MKTLELIESQSNIIAEAKQKVLEGLELNNNLFEYLLERNEIETPYNLSEDGETYIEYFQYYTVSDNISHLFSNSEHVAESSDITGNVLFFCRESCGSSIFTDESVQHIVYKIVNDPDLKDVIFSNELQNI